MSKANCYASSSEHSIDTVIFCGKAFKPTETSFQPCKSSLVESTTLNVPHGSSCVRTTPRHQSTNSKRVIASHVDDQQPNVDPTMSPNHQCKQDSRKHNHHHLARTLGNRKAPKLVCDMGTSPLHKYTPTKGSLKSDELWIDKPRRSRRRKPVPPILLGKEIWIDGPKCKSIPRATKESHQIDCKHVEKHQRISEWVHQHAKTVWNDSGSSHTSSPTQAASIVKATASASTIITTTTDTNTGELNGPSDVVSERQTKTLLRIEPSSLPLKPVTCSKKIDTNEIGCQTDLNKLNGEEVEDDGDGDTEARHEEKNERNGQPMIDTTTGITSDNDREELKLNKNELILGIDEWEDNCEKLLFRGALSDCCDNEIWCSCSQYPSDDENYDESDDFHDNVDVQSEPIAEPPRQLKLEQFLKQLLSITNTDLTKNNAHNIEYHQNHFHDQLHYDSLPRIGQNKIQGDCRYSGTVPSHDSREPDTHVTSEPINSSSLIPDFVRATYQVPINDDVPKNHVAFIPTSPRIDRILGKPYKSYPSCVMTLDPTPARALSSSHVIQLWN